MDLQQLGQLLREQRRQRKLPRARVARVAGISPTYLWMLEEARERARGEPSRPSRFLLTQLAHVLEMDDTQTAALLRLADYEPVSEEIPVSSARVVEREGAQNGVSGKLASLLEEVSGILPQILPLATRLREEIASDDLREFSSTEPLFEALKLMEERDFSQVIVRDHDHLSLMTLAGVARWLRAGGELADAEVGTVLQVEDKDRCHILSANAVMLDAVTAFRDANDLYAILLTESGASNEPPVGIVTPWDLVEVVRENASRIHRDQ